MNQIVSILPAAFLVLWVIPLVLDFYGYWKVGVYPKPLRWVSTAVAHMFSAAQYMMVIIPLAVLGDALNNGFPIDPWIAFIVAALACKLRSPAIGIYEQIARTFKDNSEELKEAYLRGKKEAETS